MSNLLRRWAGPILVAATGTAMLAATWETWPDPITDFGKEVYIAWQLSQGKRLYLDVAYHLGPLSPYLNAFVFTVFGPTLRSLQGANLLVLTALTILLYRLLYRVAGAYGAALAGIILMTLFAFIHFTPIADYNYLSPYDHAHTHGLFLGTMALTFAARYRRTGGGVSLFFAGLAVGMAFLTRAELFAAAAAGTATVLFLYPKQISPWKARKILLLAAGFFVPVLIAFLSLVSFLPSHLAIRGLLGSWPIVLDRSVTANPFYRDSMGTLDLPASLRRITLWTFCWAVLLLPAIAAGRLNRHKNLWTAAAFLYGAIGAYLTGFLLNPPDAFTPLPLALVACWFWCVRRGGAALPVSALPVSALPVSQGQSSRPFTSVVPLTAGLIVWSLALLAKIILNARIYHYGFALAMPATLLVAALAAGRGSMPVRALVTGILTVVIAAYLNLGFNLISHQTYSMGSGADQFWAGDHGKILNDCLDVLHHSSAPGQTLAVVPEGAMLNFLEKMPNPTPYWSYNPPYSFFAPGQEEAAGERKIADALTAHPPDWIVLSSADLSDFGTRFFGKDYGQAINAAISGTYTVVWTEGDRPFTGGGFGVMLLRRDRYNNSSTSVK